MKNTPTLLHYAVNKASADDNKSPLRKALFSSPGQETSKPKHNNSNSKPKQNK